MNCGDRVVDVERAFLARDLGEEHRLQKKVAQLFRESAAIIAIDRVDDLVRLFHDERLEAGQRLFAIPGATVWTAKRGHQMNELIERALRHAAHSISVSIRAGRTPIPQR